MTEVRLRPAGPADRAFFREVYASTRADELARVPWDEAAKQAFVDHQFAAQTAHYEQHYVGATVDVVVVGGQDAGRLYVYRGEREIRIVDIALLPACRGTGAGTALLAALQDEALAAGKTLSIHVEQGSPARSLYDRLGFVEVEERGAHHYMTWTPEPQPNTAS
ncbi:MAG TPA: GNAT family N-acetyltransferase [Frankiaceae bacterium]|nr:GNAT family N-acetyltransferase [Frankiaceae bacterium]